MIRAIINGQAACPDSRGSIKLTRENPFLTEGSERTMEVRFPLDIVENRQAFGAIGRLDTRFASQAIPDCALLAGDRELIRGVGTITAVTADEVRLQILAGRSAVRYDSSYDNIFIDQIDAYGAIDERHAYLRSGLAPGGAALDYSAELSSQGFVGHPGRYAFMPIHDATNDTWANVPLVWHGEPRRYSLARPAVQPSLMWVVTSVLRYLGYTVTANHCDVTPWDKLYIASARRTLELRRALPHWSVATLLDEFSHLFNARFIFDHARHTVSIVPFAQAASAATVAYQPADGFSSSFDDEGIEYLGASNIAYELAQGDRGDVADCLPQDVLEAFTEAEYDTFELLSAAFAAMTQKQKLTTIMRCPQGFFYGRPVHDEQTGQITSVALRQCGWFTTLIRRQGSSTVSLRIVPVAMSWQQAEAVSLLLGGVFVLAGHTTWGYHCWCPNIDNTNEVPEGFYTQQDEEQLDYVTVSDVLDEGASLPGNDTGDGQPMQVFFVSGSCYTATDLVKKEGNLDVQLDSVKHPQTHTDYWQQAGLVPRWSLALHNFDQCQCVGQFHYQGFNISRTVDGNNEISIPFLCDGMPDPTLVYVFSGKRYLCSKIEATIEEGELSPLKMGYFYQMQ